MAKKFLKFVNKLALGLVSVGALNWLLTSLAKFDLVTTITNVIPVVGLSTWIYSLIGIAGGWIGILALMGKVTIR